MKKVFVILVSAFLLLSVAIGASAAENTKIYIEIIPSGKLTENVSIPALFVNGSYSAPLTGMVFGGEFGFDNFKAGIEYGTASSSQTPEVYATNSTVLKVKLGSRVVKSDQLIVDLIGSYYSLDFNISNTSSGDIKNQLTGFLIGGDAAINLAPQLILNGSYEFSISASATSNGTASPGTLGISLLSFRANYLITPNWGITGGYRSYSYTQSLSGATLKDTFSGMTIGFIYKL